MADARQVLLIGCEGQEGSDGRLPNEERSVPAFVARADEEVPAAAVEEDLAAGLPQEGQRVLHVESVRRLARDRPGWSESGGCRVASYCAEAKQVEHHNRPRDTTREEGPARFVGRVEIGLLRHSTPPNEWRLSCHPP